jgi:hypothetical protein
MSIDPIDLKARIEKLSRSDEAKLSVEESDFLLRATNAELARTEVDVLQPPDLLALRDRIENNPGLSAWERRLILDALMLGDYRAEHRYPPNHGPDSSPAAKAAWAILDQLPPKALTVRYRFMLGGLFAGALDAQFKAGREYERRS